jgi:hypothetical protein
MGADETGTLSALQAHREDLIDPTIAGIVQPELQRPTPDSLIRDINAAFGEQVLHITVTERKPEIQPDDMLNDLWRKSCRA